MTSPASQPASPRPSARLLVVDDESSIREALQRALTLAGHAVDEAASGEEALTRLADSSYDLMILDLNMPGLQGNEVMAQAHHLYPDLRIITIGDAVDLFRQKHQREELGEVTSSPAYPATSPHLLAVAHLQLDCETRRVLIQEEGPRMIELSDGEYQILRILMQAPNRVFSCRELVEQVWGHEESEAEARSLIRPYIFRLRQKLEAAPHTPRLLRTVRGKGYLLAPP